MRIKTAALEKKFYATLGIDCAVRRFDADTDTFSETTESLIVEPQNITYRPLNRYEISAVGQPIPIQRLKVYSKRMFSDFRDEIDWQGETYRVREISEANSAMPTMNESTFVRVMNKS